ncbi:MAG: hypothetical protein PHD65_10935 [Gallionella sp.]|nr:hypothetical protein [Gallionella sp.]
MKKEDLQSPAQIVLMLQRYECELPLSTRCGRSALKEVEPGPLSLILEQLTVWGLLYG